MEAESMYIFFTAISPMPSTVLGLYHVLNACMQMNGWIINIFDLYAFFKMFYHQLIFVYTYRFYFHTN